MMAQPRVAIIGAGPCGLSCAHALRQAGIAPVIFEKSRGFGGRVATRRRGGLVVDHGAQALAGRSDAARSLIEAARAAGQAEAWPAGEAAFGDDAWIGTPGMKDILTPLAEGAEITYASLVTEVTATSDRVRLALEDGTAAKFDFVASSIPAPQVLRFLDDTEVDLRAELEPIGFSSSCVVMVQFATRPDWPEISVNPGGPFELVLRDSSKPGRQAAQEYWVAQADDAWSKRHSDNGLEEVGRLLLAELEMHLGPCPRAETAAGHRWRFSRVETPLGKTFARSADGRLLVGGDWTLGVAIEDALESGLAMGQEIARQISRPG